MSVDIIAQLAAGASNDDRLSGLTALKNDVVGHSQKKEQWIRSGVLRPLVSIVDNSRSEERVRLAALQLLACFASAGASFLPPIHASGALPAVLNCLQNGQPQIVLAALRVLRDVAEACASAPSLVSLNPTALADLVFTDTCLESFATILSHASGNRYAQPQVTIVARLVSTLCREEKHQYALVNHGILDALATRLAGVAVAEGQVVPRAEVMARAEGLFEFMPDTAKPDSVQLSDILGAIGAIITDSAFRSCRLLYSPSILAVFPNIDSDWGMLSLRPESQLAGLRPTKQKEYEPMDLLLPYMPNQTRQQQNSTSARVATSRFNPGLAGKSSLGLDVEFDANEDEEEAETPLIPWLVNLVRSRDGVEALAAASVLTSLYKCGFAYKSREVTLGLLVVPKLLQLLAAASGYDNQDDLAPSQWFIIEQTPAVLSRLITDSEFLQKAASESNAVKTLSKLLKSTYDSPPPTAPPLWSPFNDMGAPQSIAADSHLGEPGVHPVLAHRIRLRETTLKALGSIAAFKEDYRKIIVDQDAVPYIIESLSPSPGRPKQPRAEDQNSEEAKGQFGSNPTSVLVAACYATRMLSRSVSTLRTTLVDSGAAAPIYHLLRHADIDVQIAATAAICNLVTDFSPMRDTLTGFNVVKVLCDHARSLNAALRLNALWALKHLVHSASVELKKMCLEELQSGWLVQLICDDTEDEALFSSRSRDKHGPDDFDEEMEMADDVGRPSSLRNSGSRILRLADTKLSGLREAELNPVRKARQDDLAIQEQGLGFIRNLIGNSQSSINADSTNDTAEMIDFLFNTLGQDRFFNILATKLRVKVLHAFSGRRGTTGSDTRVLYPQAKIIEAVVYILVHMAASIPRHRQLVIAQTELLKLLATLFNSQDREVRVALCHLLNNLTWQDDANDAPACSQRAVELKKLGFLTKLESLGSDEELDVRERAKSALWQMKHG
ncbi:armadillo-type protein [Truncatella angustata]|uniref:Armadillo-type protein n=1 Tax=Truncatella angustata TaxID=152316 RepID=A0A9P8UPU5_9PEZI|nr:armadillo-type protein [Truncatella angustata]KAH6656725.1 armadillo-type protein [Truncatella angustata]